MILVFNKPYGILSQFTKQEPDHRTLAEFGFPENVYPIGRLDWDSEGLLLLTDEKHWNDMLLHPRNAHERTYHAQVEGIATEEAMEKLRKGISVQDYTTKPCAAKLLEDPGRNSAVSARSPEFETPVFAAYPERNPPIRFRLSVPTSWIEPKMVEGKNRQVRRMTAAVGFPTLRLIRVAFGALELGALPAGKWQELSPKLQKLLKMSGT